MDGFAGPPTEGGTEDRNRWATPGRDRLRRLRDRLRGHRPLPAGFDIEDWAYADPERDAAEGRCGTTACAAGHAALMPEFQAEGLFLAQVGTQGKDRLLRTVADIEDAAARDPAAPVFVGLRDGDPGKDMVPIASWRSHGYEAVAEFFGIAEDAAEFLFRPSRYPPEPSLADVVARMDLVLGERAAA